MNDLRTLLIYIKDNFRRLLPCQQMTFIGAIGPILLIYDFQKTACATGVACHRRSTDQSFSKSLISRASNAMCLVTGSMLSTAVVAVNSTGGNGGSVSSTRSFPVVISG